MRTRPPSRACAGGVLVAGILLGLAACGAPSVEGTWVVDWSEMIPDQAPTKEGKALLQVAEVLLTPSAPGLWLRGDGRCFYRGKAFGEVHDTPAGRWDQDGDVVWITRDVDAEGKPIADAQRVRTSLRLVDGRLHGALPGMKGNLILKRAVPGQPAGPGSGDSRR